MQCHYQNRMRLPVGRPTSRAIPYENQKCQGVELKIAPRVRVNLEVQGPEDVVRSQHFSPINDDAAPVCV